MNPDPERLKQIFAQALKIESASEREGYLEAACRNDPELHKQIESLLGAHEQAGAFLGQTMKLPPLETLLEPVGTMVGRYKLLEKIGEGGFGVVYMAEQQEPVQRKVALKIIKAGMDTKEVIARFEAERQALALMDHPNIARVLDAGATEKGRPYFVMELVKGVPMTEYCDQNSLTTQERLRLFMRACQAVQHAHQKAVIHRDLKPSNILVTLHDGDPVPKVIDFGVAKALGQKLTEKTLFTAFRQMIGTPAYMSPEQAEMSGLDIDTRSDIYSLGVLLYELLVGVTPFDKETLAKAALDEIRRMIRETEPPKPSTRLRTLGEKLNEVARHRQTESGMLSKFVRGDLDWIVMRCLEKDRKRRYETANGLARDIERFLNSEPVSAAAPSPMYRAHKFVRRHKTGLSVVSAFVLLLAVGASVTLWQAIRAIRAERMQRQLLQRALQAEQDSKEKLWASYLDQAHARRWSGQPGRRFEALEAITKAAVLRPSLDLRNEAIACMALTDLRISREWECPPDTTILAFDEKAERYARGQTNGEITIRRVDNDREILRLPGQGNPAWGIAFSPNGNSLAARYNFTGIQVWDLARTNLLLNGPFGAFAFSPDSQRIAIESGAGINLYHLASGVVGRIEVGTPFNLLAFDPTGRKLAVSCQQHGVAVHVFNAETGVLIIDLVHPPGVADIAWHPSGRYLAGASQDTRVYVWDLEGSREPIRSLAGHRVAPFSVAFAHTDDLLASIGYDQTIRLWDPFTATLLLTDFGAPVIGFPQVQFCSDDRTLCYAARGRRAGLWEVATARECRGLRSTTGWWKAPWHMAFSQDGRLLASSHVEGVRLWDISTGRELALLPIGYTRTALFDPSNRMLLTCREDAGVHRWPLRWDHDEQGKILRIGPPEIVELPAGTVPKMISLAADGRTVAVADLAHGQVILSDLENRNSMRTIPGHSAIVEVALSPDGKWVASSTWSSFPAVLRVAEVATGKLVLHSDSNQSRHAIFSPNNQWLIYSDDEKCKVVEVGSWRLVREFAKEPGAALMTMSSDSTILALSQSPQAVKLFNVASDWSEVASLDASDPIRYYPSAFSPDGSHLAVITDNQIIKLWDLRLIRSQLTSLRLDWDSPPLPAATEFEEPIHAIVELNIENASDAQRSHRAHANVENLIAPRDPKAAPNLIDLSRFYNATLTNNWFGGKLENSFTDLPQGLQRFAGVDFDVRGLVQLDGLMPTNGLFPRKVAGIPLGLNCRRIHFLHATQRAVFPGTRIGGYKCHYADGSSVDIPVVYGVNTRDWWVKPNEPAPPSTLELAWSGSNEQTRSAGTSVRLFKYTWENSSPDKMVTALDLESAMTDCSPFLIAITAEP